MKTRSDIKKETLVGCGLQAAMVAILLIIGASIWCITSRMEAKAYNRITGADVTTWEAMWVQLRVDSSARGGRE